MTKPTKWVCVQRRLRSAWASAQSDQSSLCIQWVAKAPTFLHADSEDCQTGQMPRLIWIFAGCTCHFVGFVMRRLISFFTIILLPNGRLISLNQNVKFISFSVSKTGSCVPRMLCISLYILSFYNPFRSIFYDTADKSELPDKWVFPISHTYWSLVFWWTGPGKQWMLRSDGSQRSSLIMLYTACHYVCNFTCIHIQW